MTPARGPLDARGTVAQLAAVPLRLDLVRHGAASPAAGGGDAERPLSPEGVRAVRALAERLALEGWAPERVLSSPYQRARATAEILLEAAGLSRPVELLAELEPDRNPAELAAALAACLDGARHAVLVSHQPLAGLLAEQWCGADVFPGPGTLLQLEFDAGPGRGPGRLVRHLK